MELGVGFHVPSFFIHGSTLLASTSTLATGDEKKKRRHKGKHHKHSKQKKEKRSRKDADERGDVGNEDLELPEMDPRFSP